MSRRFAVALLVTTAGLHAAVVPEHAREWHWAAMFFVALTAVELGLALALTRRLSRRALAATVAVSGATAALWVVSRTSGLPFGPEAFAPEPATTLDIASTVLEVATAAVCLRLLFRTVDLRRVGLATAAASVVVLTGACGGGSSPAKQAEPAETTTSAATTVHIDTFAFEPKLLHVHVGDAVVWTNGDNILHTVTAGTREYEPGNSGHVTATHKSGLFDEPLDGKGATFRFTFRTAGTVHYFCDRHPGMEADIEVS